MDMHNCHKAQVVGDVHAIHMILVAHMGAIDLENFSKMIWNRTKKIEINETFHYEEIKKWGIYGCVGCNWVYWGPIGTFSRAALCDDLEKETKNFSIKSISIIIDMIWRNLWMKCILLWTDCWVWRSGILWRWSEKWKKNIRN